MIAISLFLLLSIILYLIHWQTLKRLDKYKAIAGPIGIPVLGSVYHFIYDDVKEVQKRTMDWFILYGDTYKIYCSWLFIVVTANAKAARDLLSASNKNMEKNYLYTLLRRWLMEGLLLSVDRKWHSRRKIITPAFHFNILESFVPIFDHQADILVEKIRKLKLSSNDVFDIHDFIARMTLDAIAETSMGIQSHAQSNDSCVYTKAVTEMSHCVLKRFSKFYWRNDLICFFLGNSLLKEYNSILKTLHSFTEDAIIKRRELLESNTKDMRTNLEPQNNLKQKRRMVFLDILLRSTIDGKPLSNLDIREEVDTFMFEGHDTTTAALCFTLYLISRHPSVQSKMFNEIVEVIGKDKTKSISCTELNCLQYLDLVIKESLRMYPPVAVIGRVITESSVINGILYPKGTHVVIHLQKMMRNSEVFNNPDEFIPERHCTADYLDEDPFAYIPFSAGPRNCIGQKYAMLEMKTVITKILQNFELLPNGPEIEALITVILKSTTGFHMSFKYREYE